MSGQKFYIVFTIPYAGASNKGVKQIYLMRRISVKNQLDI